MQLITCPGCRAQLLISDERAPKCGKCGEPIWYQTKQAPGLFARLRARLFTKKEKRAKSAPILPSSYTNLQAKADLLAKKTWGAREDIKAVRLDLPPKAIAHHAAYDELIAALLRHVHKIAPNISVPMMTPRVVVAPMTEAAGQFIEQDGWVKITVNPSFFHNMPAARAILCHEICHYVLFANGIRQSPTLENERLTDTAIFVFGLGDIFLEGYQRSESEYRTGHRLGYLNDEEYIYLKQYVTELRS